MFEQFNQFILQEKLFGKQNKILLAVSGGIDSVVMCSLFHQAKLQFAIAHCNFKLRGKESDEDEFFVKSLAKKYKVKFYSSSFSTRQFSAEKGISIQMAARELRYIWLENIRKRNSYDCIAVAHHKDDSVETFFINLTRGTGISGLHGILPKQNHIVRPLLFAEKGEIESFAKKNKLLYREDSSNKSDKYLRNKIRHHLIPILKEFNPNITKVISLDMERLKEVEQIYFESIEKKKKEIIETKNGITYIPVKKLQKLNHIQTYLFEFLRPYHFNAAVVKNIIESIETSAGKQFFSSTHRLVKDRKNLIISEKIERTKGIKINYSIKNKKKFNIPSKNNIACLDYDLIETPLKIRKWKNGDFFYPLGMQQKKKLSDFLIDNKISIPDKEKIHVLTSGKEIVWVIGKRIDDRYKITGKTKKVYVCELIEE